MGVKGAYRARIGAYGEDIAASFLKARGYAVIERNYRCRFGEIDLICMHGATVAFCEVKLRQCNEYGTPEEAITPAKLRHLLLAAQTYLAESDNAEADWRVDVVTIEVDRRGHVVRTELYQGIDV